jgi:hypothetical protein
VALHLIKLCVGCDSVKDLEDWIRTRLKDRKKRGLPREHLHTTRMVPKRADELVDGGSLYWVIRGQVMCRQPMRAVRPFVDKEGVGRCRLATAPRPAPRTCPRRCGASCATLGCCDGAAGGAVIAAGRAVEAMIPR